MTYSVKEMFKTLQGEGFHAGRSSVFCRFTGCNLWSGREADRSGAICKFCDTDFVGIDGVGGGRFETEDSLAAAIESVWNGGRNNRFVVFTGGEPILQLDQALIDAVHRRGFEIAVETNGTLPVPNGVDWICVSPKRDAPLRQRSGSELKLVFPQGDEPRDLQNLQFDHFWIQPMDGPEKDANTKAAIDFCLNNPKWRLSLQTHKLLGIP